jgi:hypothetical protein
MDRGNAVCQREGGMGIVSRDFNDEEFVVSSSYPQVAAAIEPTRLDKYKFFWLVHLFLQPIRDAINRESNEEIPIIISSALRRGELNGLVGGVAHSDHLFSNYSAAVDFRIGEELISKYWEIIYSVCEKKKEFIKQFIRYLPSAGDFIHLSLRDKTTRVWERLWCVSREGRRYFNTSTEAEDYLRNISG